MDRRTVVAAMGTGIVSLSGCIGQVLDTGSSDSEGAPDLRVSNETSNSITATVRAVSDGEEIFSETITLEPNDEDNSNTQEYDDVVADETATITVSVEEGPEAEHEFTDESSDAQGVFIDIYADRIEFQNYSK
jgi:hypothetical protein